MPEVQTDYWLLDRETGPEEREQLQISGDAIVFFTSEEKALAYRNAFPDGNWEEAAMLRADVLDLLAELRECGFETVAFDPSPTDDGRVVMIFEAIFELS